MNRGGNGIQAFVVGAQRGRRRLDNAQSAPPALRGVSGDETILDWLLHALHDNDITQITYAGGYHIEKVIARYPELSYQFVPDWATIGELALAHRLLPDQPAGDVLLVQGDLVALPAAIAKVLASSGEAVVATYGKNAQFARIVLIRRNAIARLKAAIAAQAKQPAGTSLLLAIRGQNAVTCRDVDLSDLAAPVDDQMAAYRIVFAGKGRTLEQIRPLLKGATVLDLVRLAVARWHADRKACLAAIRNNLAAPVLIVRSSTAAEDSLTSSQAGHFLSVGGVPRDDDAALAAAIDQVVASYGRSNRVPSDDDEVLVQPFVSGLAASGVLLTRDIDTAAPYFVVSLDGTTGRADAVTSGADARIETHYTSWNADASAPAPAVGKAIELARELMRLTGLDALDIEFALSRDDELYLLQVRPFAVRQAFALADDDLLDAVDDSRRFVRVASSPAPFLLGRSTLLGTMTDWNPAEMIGLAPTALALSLYQRLIGDLSWAEARAAIGYRDVRPVPLVVSVGGIPYVDIRASLNSLLPAGLDDAIGAAWIDNCMARLKACPWLHDKLEFDVTLTCLDADVARAMHRLEAAGLTSGDAAHFAAALRALTNRVVADAPASISARLGSVMGLESARRRLLAQPGDPIRAFASARALLERCRTDGVVPFAVLARYAFVALALLRSLRAVGALGEDDVESFMRAVPTVAGEFSRDIRAFACGRVPRDVMIARYGHLRPSTYQITSPCYAAAPDLFFATRQGADTLVCEQDPAEPIAILERRAAAVDRALAAAGLEFDHRQLAGFAAAAISGRERAKFEFTKNLSFALERIAEGGAFLGLDRETMAHLPVETILRLATDGHGKAEISQLRRNASFNEKKWRITKALRMPDLILGESSVGSFKYPEGQPNFITRHRVVAPAAVVEGMPRGDLSGKIVLIQAADPGFDWIFSYRLAGLVTQFGGVASHMAIRAMEFDLPAAIGCGASLFNQLAKAATIELDCANRKIVPANQ